MNITDQQFEAILLRLEGGESMDSVQADFPHLVEDLAALQDLQDFFAAQRSQVLPDPNGLKSVLHNLKAQADVAGDDDFSWGSFFADFRRSFAVALPVIAVLGVSGYVWQSQLPPENTPFAVSDGLLVAQTDTDDMAALAESLSAEFALDMEEFKNTQTELQPFYEEQLFTYDPTATL